MACELAMKPTEIRLCISPWYLHQIRKFKLPNDALYPLFRMAVLVFKINGQMEKFEIGYGGCPVPLLLLRAASFFHFFNFKLLPTFLSICVLAPTFFPCHKYLPHSHASTNHLISFIFHFPIFFFNSFSTNQKLSFFSYIFVLILNN